MERTERVAPPRGVRGLKLLFSHPVFCSAPVAPPRGVRGLKYDFESSASRRGSRTPSWGAWIEIRTLHSDFEIGCVAPPRGVRGLKCLWLQSSIATHSRTPSWGAWIEIPMELATSVAR